MESADAREPATADAVLLRTLTAVAQRTGNLQYARTITLDIYRRVLSEQEGAGPEFGSMLSTALKAATHMSDDVDRAAADDTLSDSGVIASLRPADRQLLRLVYWDHLSMAELADYLDCSIAEAGRRLDRAYRRAEKRLRRASHPPKEAPVSTASRTMT
ncbi:DNA-directed RNA polymerase specialized sigma24 family protein [Pseudarthrobacter sp. PvP004]|uniref:RNA polymerase sigma factor n=1 Tax=Pseudarthrobacter sp. PvP004 TaxID=2817850 RepID=UPI001AE524D0|nr:sigma-70 family RNA polymerase sigma factor [Pseudarthrobacter sp. PvP004]MBP2269297.1 DNA-directed RNA polymerase specialized sigma24 family protein [Pseudarthrobacter sp. PvP004]